MLGETKVLFDYIHFLKNAQKLFFGAPTNSEFPKCLFDEICHQLEEAFE